MKRLGIYAVVIVIAMVIGFFTVDSDDVVKFNDKLVAIAGNNSERYDGYTTEINLYLTTGKCNASKLRSEQAKIKSGLESDLKQINETKVPDKDSCREFHTAVHDFVQYGQDCLKEYEQMTTYIEGHLPGQSADVTYIMATMEKIGTEDNKRFLRVQNTQKAMASEFGLQIK